MHTYVYIVCEYYIICDVSYVHVYTYACIYPLCTHIDHIDR